MIVVEDGSEVLCESECNYFRDQLEVKYLFQDNTGQGFARNYGFSQASGDYFIVFDSDCIIPPGYMGIVNNYLQKLVETKLTPIIKTITKIIKILFLTLTNIIGFLLTINVCFGVITCMSAVRIY